MTTEDVREINLDKPISVPVSVDNADEIIAELKGHFAERPAMLARIEALEALDDEAKAKWLLSRRPARDIALRELGCVVVVVWTTVVVVVGYKVYKYYDAKLKEWKERREAITKEKKVKEEKEVCEEKD